MKEGQTLRQSILALLITVSMSFGAGLSGSQFKPGSWYEQLNKPPWTPPNWVFAPVWSVLYLTMGVAAWLVWRQSGVKKALPALLLFASQLLLNAAWSLTFFGLQRPGLAFGEIVLLWGAILGTVVLFWRENVGAGILLVPYLAWVTFAAVLNLSLWRLNL